MPPFTAKERAALEMQLLASHVDDLRKQLQAAVDLLCERTGMTREQTNAALVARIQENRGK